MFIFHDYNMYFVLICRNVDLGSLKHEAEYYGIKPLGVYIRYIYFITYYKKMCCYLLSIFFGLQKSVLPTL